MSVVLPSTSLGKLYILGYRGCMSTIKVSKGLTSIPCNASSNLATILLADKSFYLIMDN